MSKKNNPKSTGQEIFVEGYIIHGGKTSELNKRLETTVTILSRLSPDETRPEGLEYVAAALIDDTLLNSKNQEVLDYTAMCLCEILRIYAPNAPYKNDQLILIFSILAKQIKMGFMNNKSSDASYQRTMFILKSLADVQCARILPELAMDKNKHIANGAEEGMVDLFNTLLDSVQPGAPSAVTNPIRDIIAGVIDELQDLPNTLLETLLYRLIMVNPSSGSSSSSASSSPSSTDSSSLSSPNDSAYGIVAETIRRNIDKLSTPIAHFCKYIMRDIKELGKLSRITKVEDAHAIALQLPSISLLALDQILPSIADQLELENINDRLIAIVTLGKLFAQPLVNDTLSQSNYATSGPLTRISLINRYKTIYDQWLRHFHDKEPEIRKIMCKCSGEILSAHDLAVRSITDALINRMQEVNDDVRFAAVYAVCDAATARLANVSKNLLIETAKRNLDKRVDIRREVITGLAQTYIANMKNIWNRMDEHADTYFATASGKLASTTTLDALPKAFSVPTYQPSPSEIEIIDKLAWIPDYIIQCFEHPEPEVKIRVLQLLDNILLPDDMPVKVRARGLALIYASLKSTSRRAFHRMQLERRRVQLDMNKFLALREEYRTALKDNSTTDGMKEVRMNIGKVIATLSDKSSNRAKVVASFHALYSQVIDNRVFLRLGVLADPTVPLQGIIGARNDVLGRLKSIASTATTTSMNSKGIHSNTAIGKNGTLIKSSTANNVTNETTDMKAVHETVRVLLRRMNMCTATIDMVPHLINIAMEQIACGIFADANATIALITEFSSIFPMLFGTPKSTVTTPLTTNTTVTTTTKSGKSKGKIDTSNTTEEMEEDGNNDKAINQACENNMDANEVTKTLSRLLALLNEISFTKKATVPVDEQTSAQFIVPGLRIITLLGKDIIDILPNGVKTSLQQRILTLATEGTFEQAKHAIYSAVALYSTGNQEYSFIANSKSTEEGFENIRQDTSNYRSSVTDPFFETLINKLVASNGLSIRNESLPAVIASLGALALRAPTVYALLDKVSVQPGSTATKGKNESITSPQECGNVTKWLLKFIESDPTQDDVPSEYRRTSLGTKTNDTADIMEDDEGDTTVSTTKSKTGGGTKKRNRDDNDTDNVKQESKRLSVESAAGNGGDRTFGYKTFRVSFSIINRILALKAVGNISRGLFLYASHLRKVALTNGDTTANGKIEHITVMGLARGMILTSITSKFLGNGGSLFHGRGRQLYPLSAKVIDLSSTTTTLTTGTTPPRSSSPRYSTVSSDMSNRRASSGTVAVTEEGSTVEHNADDAPAMRTVSAITSLHIVNDTGPLDIRLLPTSRWIDVAFTLHDANLQVRTAVLAVLGKLLRSLKMPLRYLAWPAYCSIDPVKDMRSTAKTLLNEAAILFARQAGRIRAVTALGGSVTTMNPELETKAARFQPEMCLPFLLLLLSRDERRCPSVATGTSFIKNIGGGKATIDSIEKAGIFHDQAVTMNALLDAILAAAPYSQHTLNETTEINIRTVESGSLRILNTIYKCMLRIDDTDRPNQGLLNIMNDIYFFILKARMRDSSSFEAYPGQIPLPPGVFTVKQSTNVTSSTASAGTENRQQTGSTVGGGKGKDTSAATTTGTNGTHRVK